MANSHHSLSPETYLKKSKAKEVNKMGKLDEKTPVIQKTYDYGKFKLLKENRPILPHKVAKIAESIKEDDQSPYRPILVDGNFGIIDGQHQFKAEVKLGYPVYYVQNPNAKLRTIMLLNAFTTSWKMDNYAHYYAKQGLQTYIDCIKFSEKYKISIALSMNSLSLKFTDAGNLRANFKDGAFVIPDMEAAIKFMDQVTALRPFMTDDVFGSRDFYTAFMRLLEQVEYLDFKEILSKKRLKIEYRGSKKEYLREFEDIVNYEKSKNLVRLY